MKKKECEKDILWTDDYGFHFSLEEMIEEIKYLRILNTKFHLLLIEHKVSVREVANVTNQVKKQLYSVEDSIEKVDTAQKRKYTKKSSSTIKYK